MTVPGPTSPRPGRTIFAGPFLLNPPPNWRVEWASDIEGTMVRWEPVNGDGLIWRLTGEHDYSEPGIVKGRPY